MPLLKSKKCKPKTLQQQTEVNLYQLRSRINQLYFSTFLQERHAILMTKQEQLESKIGGEIWNKVWCHPSRRESARGGKTKNKTTAHRN
jgi:hypothetical protein